MSSESNFSPFYLLMPLIHLYCASSFFFQMHLRSFPLFVCLHFCYFIIQYISLDKHIEIYYAFLLLFHLSFFFFSLFFSHFIMYRNTSSFDAFSPPLYPSTFFRNATSLGVFLLLFLLFNSSLASYFYLKLDVFSKHSSSVETIAHSPLP